MNTTAKITKTGEKCQVSGVYYCALHHSSTITLSEGEIFPLCSLAKGHGTTWFLKTPLKAST